MSYKLNVIQCYPDELFKTYWVPWCEGFLSKGIITPEQDIPQFSIKDIPGMPDNSTPASRAVELYRVGTFKHPINVKSQRTKAWELLRQKKSVVTDFGYIAYLISKNTILTAPGLSQTARKSFSALCAISLIAQHYNYSGSRETKKLSLNTVFQGILNNYTSCRGNYGGLQYLASGMVCTLKSAEHREDLITQILSRESIPELIITNNGSNTVRERITPENIDSRIRQIADSGLDLNGTTNQRFPNFFIGNYNQQPQRGFLNNASGYFSSFLEDCAQIEIAHHLDGPFDNIYSNENYVYENNWYDVLHELKSTFNKYLPESTSLEELMDTLKDGAMEAISNLDWHETKPTRSDGSGDNWIYYGAPGTGKSYKVDRLLKSTPSEFIKRVTFHPEYDYASFVGGYKPAMKESDEGQESIVFSYIPQALTEIYTSAWNDLENNYYLIIEEINRGNCAEIFGDFFQLLDRNNDYAITPSKELCDFLSKSLSNPESSGLNNGKMMLPPNLHIYATMNTSDQSLFPMDSAFKRRWNWEYVPICYVNEYEDGQSNDSFNYRVNIGDGRSFSWIEFIKITNIIIRENPNLGMDKCIGNYFVKAKDGDIDLEVFINKVIFYLWNDVFKDEDESIFPDDTFYEDFFPISTNGIRLVLDMIEKEPFDVMPVLADSEKNIS
jgi:hypothetical protein